MEAAAADYPAVAKGLKNEPTLVKQDSLTPSSEGLSGPNGEEYPSAEDWATLRRVYGKVDWVSRGSGPERLHWIRCLLTCVKMIYVIGLIEMCERFAYYGTTAVCMYKSYQLRRRPLTKYGRQLYPATFAY